jgi:DNA-binding transcriptional LysR family regulator
MDRFKLMETYAAVVKLGSYTTAARELGVTRAMVSKRLQDLEASLGVKLLNRNTRRLSATSAGQDYFENCVAILKAVHAGEERIIGKRSGARGELKILCSKTFGEMLLTPIIADFCTEYPNISVLVTLADMRPDSNEIVSRGFDLAIRTLPVRPSQVVARAIASLPRVLVAAPRYLERAGVPLSPEQLAAHNCLDPRGAFSFSWDFVGPKGRRTLRLSGSPTANSSMLIRQAALKGLGIAMMRRYLVGENLTDRSLVPVLEDFTVGDDKLYVVYQKDRYQPARMRLFIDYLTARVAALLSTDRAGMERKAGTAAAHRRLSARP